MQSAVSVQFVALPHGRDLPLPEPGTALSAGLDLMAAIDGDLCLAPGERALIPCGFAMALPPGYEAQIRPRSGLSFKNGVTVLNSPGTIDADYRGEVKVLLINLGQEDFTVTRGMRVAQLVVASFKSVAWAVVSEFSSSEEGNTRGVQGFGSTGLQALGKAS